MECGETRKKYFQINKGENYLKLNKDSVVKFSKSTVIEIQSPNWGGNKQLSTEGIPVE